VQEHGSGSITDVSSFISVASTLILIKSKSLLPKLDLSVEEEEDVDDLKRRLRLYQLFQEISSEVGALFGKSIILPQGETKRSDIVFSPDEQITIDAMLSVAGEVLAAVPEIKEKKPEISIARVMSIDEMISSLSDRISKTFQTSFRDFSDPGDKYETPKEQKVHVIVSFLAMLELAREGILALVQDNNFDDISISKHEKEDIIEESYESEE
jgi:segregation and condensation protein A